MNQVTRIKYAANLTCILNFVPIHPLSLREVLTGQKEKNLKVWSLELVSYMLFISRACIGWQIFRLHGYYD